MLRIAYIGNHRVPFSTESDLCWTLEDMGHEVIRLQEDDYWTPPLDIDLLFYTHTHGWITPADLPSYFDELRLRGIPTVGFHLDYWRGLARESDVGNHLFWHTKYTFTADGGSNDWYRKQGINHFWLPPGVLKRDCYYADPKDEYLHDVIFVGSRAYHPEWSYRPKLVNWLEQTYGARFAHYGNDGRRALRGEELNRLYRTAKVVVGDSLCLGFKHPDYFSDRVTETMGRGGFLIHPEIPGMPKLFKDGTQITYYQFGDFKGLKEKIDYYVENYAAREALRLKAHLNVKEHHTYHNRISKLLEIVAAEEAKITA